MEQRLRRTIELSSDIEFQVLRLEKRMETLISLNIEGQGLSANPQSASNTNAVVGSADNTGRTAGSDTLAGGQAPSVVISRDEDTGETVWTVNEDQLNSALQADNNQSDNTGVSGDGDDLSIISDSRDADGTVSNVASGSTASDTPELESVNLPSILPDAEPEEQFKFALSRALQNEFDLAEQAFEEFRAVNPEHARAAKFIILAWARSTYAGSV